MIMSMYHSTKKGFTIIEVLVSVAIFSIVMLVATGSIATIVDANKKAHSLKSVMTNLNFALESMMREIRMGSNYDCSGTYCTTFTFKPNHTVCGGNINQHISYAYDTTNKKIVRTMGSNACSDSVADMTASEVSIESLRFYPLGIGTDGVQPRVILVINGTIGAGNSKSSFNIQTTISQRSIDS
jgi:prepilin-type N-terminal cleavage/methylation domain-containing protein